MILDSCDNIIDQLLLLRHFKRNKYVKKYMKSLCSDHNSPYFTYCIDKYYFGKDVPNVEIPVNTYAHLRTYGESKYISELLSKSDDIVEQMKLLRKHKNNKEVRKYIQDHANYLINSSEYVRFVLLYYYYDIECIDPGINAKTLNITLYKIYFKDDEDREEKLKQKRIKVNKRLKVGQNIMILEGPFNGMIGTLQEKKENELMVLMNLFGDECAIKFGYDTKLRKVKNVKKN